MKRNDDNGNNEIRKAARFRFRTSLELKLQTVLEDSVIKGILYYGENVEKNPQSG